MKKLLLFFVFSILFISGCREISTETAIGNYEWNKATPKSQNIDEAKLDLAFAAAEKLGFVDGLVIIRNGYLVGEEYYNGFSADKPHYIWSCTKSFVSAGVGIAIQKGFIESLDKKIMDYFPEYKDVIRDARYYDITIRHLLTMTMGIDRESKIMVPVLQSYDWIRETLKLPLIYNPGTTHSYNSLQQHLISVIIKKTSGMDLYEFTETFLTLPMGIHINDRDHDPKGNIIGGMEFI